MPISAGVACGLSLGNKILNKLILNKYNKYKKQYDRDQNTIEFFDKIYRKSLQDNVIDETEYESLSNFLLNMLMKTKMNLFHIVIYFDCICL